MRVLLLPALFVLAACGQGDRDAAERSASTRDSTAPAQPAPESALPAPTRTTAELTPTQGNGTSGALTLVDEGGGVRVTGTVTGLTPGATHGLHIHEKGDCSAPDGSSAGEHFAPLGHPHGAPGPSSHVGDLGNIQANQAGVAEVNVVAPQATLRSSATTDVGGRALIVHAKADDLQSQPAGESGDRIACAVIS